MISARIRPCRAEGEKIRVLVVDDSVVIRRLVTHALSEDPDIEVVGAASNGVLALQRIAQTNPDVVTLDIEMPEMDGLETLRHIRRQYRHLWVIMFSTLTERGAVATIDALAAGADDYVPKAANAGSLEQSLAALRNQLIPKIHQFFPRSVAAAQPAVAALRMPLAPPRPAHNAPEVIAIGVSTGGPTALGQIIPMLPAGFPLPVLIVQHMPPLFTRFLADRLAQQSKLPVEEAKENMPVVPGRIFIAPGDYHMYAARSSGQVHIHLDQAPPENSCRPSVDVLFRSVAECYGARAVCAVLTGMGQDGLRGAEALKRAGAFVFAQDEASSVVWGMPRAVVEAGLADAVVSLPHVVPEILRFVACPV